MKKSKQESAGDELYTTYETVDKILRTHIADGKLRGKRILCPCDPILPIRQQPTKVYENGVHFAQGNRFLREQQFVRWIDEHAVELGIRSLTCCGLGDERFGQRFGEDFDAAAISLGQKDNSIFDFSQGENLKDRCDMFRTSASPDYDVIITNPPFSRGSDFVYHLLKHKKDFILILPWMFYCSEAFYGNLDRVKLGTIIDKPSIFLGKNIEVNDKNVNIVHKGIEQSMTITVFTTFDVVENESLHINQTKAYRGNEQDYPFVINSKEPVIVVDRSENIPYDYEGLMCVPITVMDNFNPKEFELVGYSHRWEIDEEKNQMLAELSKKDKEKIRKYLLLKPDDEKYLKYLKRGYSDTGFLWRPGRLYYKNEKKRLIRDIQGFIIKNRPGKQHYIAPKAAPRLKNDNPLAGNKIYFYTSPLVPDCICIGQTRGDVERRVRQEFKNTPEKPYRILHSDLAQKTNGTWFSDKDFHRFLNAKGYDNEIGAHSRSNEWFKIDITTAKKLLKEYKKE